MADKRQFVEDALNQLIFSLSQGYQAQAGARGAQARSAGIGAALGGAQQYQAIQEAKKKDEEDRQFKIQQMRQALLRGDQDAALKLREAIGNPVAPTDSVTTSGLPIPVTSETEMPVPPVQYPLGGGRSMSMPVTSAQDAIRMSGMAEDQKQQILAKYRPAPQRRLLNTPGGTIDQDNPGGGFIPGTAPPAKEPTYSPENVMVDGKPALVLRDTTGRYIDANDRSPITGRITPYIAPPSPRQKGEITPTAEAGLVQNLNKQWETAAKDVQSLYRANTIMDAGMQAATRGDMNAGSQAVLVTFQKFLDPTSVVRESEYARSGAGLAMAERIRGAMEKLSQGGAGVTLPELQKFADLAKEINSRLASEGTSLLSAEKKRITGIANRYGIPAELAIPNYDFTQPAGATPKVGPKPGDLEGGYRFKGGDPADPKNWIKAP